MVSLDPVLPARRQIRLPLPLHHLAGRHGGCGHVRQIHQLEVFCRDHERHGELFRLYRGHRPERLARRDLLDQGGPAADVHRRGVAQEPDRSPLLLPLRAVQPDRQTVSLHLGRRGRRGQPDAFRLGEDLGRGRAGGYAGLGGAGGTLGVSGRRPDTGDHRRGPGADRRQIGRVGGDRAGRGRCPGRRRDPPRPIHRLQGEAQPAAEIAVYGGDRREDAQRGGVSERLPRPVAPDGRQHGRIDLPPLKRFAIAQADPFLGQVGTIGPRFHQRPLLLSGRVGAVCHHLGRSEPDLLRRRREGLFQYARLRLLLVILRHPARRQ